MQEDIVEVCRKRGIVVTAYSPLGSDGAPLIEHPVVRKLAEKYSVASSNILISLQANRTGVNGTFLDLMPALYIAELLPQRSVVPKSVTPSRIDENAKLVDLSDEDVRELTAIEQKNHKRMCKPFWTGWGAIGFPDLEEQ